MPFYHPPLGPMPPAGWMPYPHASPGASNTSGDLATAHTLGQLSATSAALSERLTAQAETIKGVSTQLSEFDKRLAACEARQPWDALKGLPWTRIAIGAILIVQWLRSHITESEFWTQLMNLLLGKSG